MQNLRCLRIFAAYRGKNDDGFSMMDFKHFFLVACVTLGGNPTKSTTILFDNVCVSSHPSCTGVVGTWSDWE